MAFQPGQSGNPTGGRKRKQFVTALEMELAAVADDDNRGLRKIARNLMELAETGDLQAVKEIRDTLDGKPAQAIIGAEEGEPGLFDPLIALMDKINNKSRSV